MNLAALDAVAAERASRDPAHDIAHVRRVAHRARELAETEGADVDVCIAAALLHELFSYPKNHPDSPRSGEVCAEHARVVLLAQSVNDETAERVCYAIAVHPFSRGIMPTTLEAKILQDADRLDAIGAIGIARCFATAGVLGHDFYSSDDPFCAARAPAHFAVDHFYAKLLRVPETLHTAAARRLASERLQFMHAFLEQLGREM